VRIFALLTCIAYWILLTLLLLTPDPAALLGLQRVPSLPWGKFGVHLSFFALLSFLVCAAWWSKRFFWPMAALLVAYGIVTESLQLLVPHRTARPLDGIENLLGIAVGAGVYWLAQASLRTLVLGLRSSISPKTFDTWHAETEDPRPKI
jgi:hypothetical protein